MTRVQLEGRKWNLGKTLISGMLAPATFLHPHLTPVLLPPFQDLLLLD